MASDVTYEYLVLVAPRHPPRIKGIRNPAERFAHAMAEVMNEAGREGWEYLRTDTLPMEARSGWFGGMSVSTPSLLVFRREVARAAEPAAPVFASAGPEGRRRADVTPIASRPATAPTRPLETPRGRAEEDDDPHPGPGHTPRLGGARRD